MDAQKWLQLSALLAQHAQMFTAQNPGQNQFAQHLLGSAQSGIMAEAIKKQRKEEEKKKKGALGGKLGSTLGAAAGIAIPGIGPAVGGALGGSLGGVAGQALAGGGGNYGSTALMGGLSGGMSGYTYGKAGEMGESVQNAADPSAPAPPAPADVVANDVKNSISRASDAVVPAAQIKKTIPPAAAPTPQFPTSTYGAAPKVETAPKPNFRQRFGAALTHTVGGTRGWKVTKTGGDQPDIYEEYWP